MILPDKEQFSFKDCIIAGDDCWLITPNRMGVDWSPENEMFRSCIVRQKDNRIVSLGLKKFVNFFETPAFQPWDNSWKFDAYKKIDGSLLIISKHNGELIIRTRGTISARDLENGHEIDILIKKYPKVFNNEYLDSENWSIHCEWTTPSRVIVLREHSEPTLTLLNMIRHDYLSYMPQKNLDLLAHTLEVDRPQKYSFNSIEECLKDVELWEGREGVVVYAQEPDLIWNNQTLKKCKSLSYLRLHRLFSGITNINHVIEVFLKSPRSYHWEDFFDYIEKTIGYEIAFRCMDHIQQVCSTYYKITHRIWELFEHLKGIGRLPTQKEKAMAIIALKLPSWEQAFCFEYLKANGDGGILDKLLLKAFDYYLENNL